MSVINTELAKKLIREQFPKWAHLPVYPVAESGNDNRTFHLGAEMSIRLPSAARYATQAEKEYKWLPYLADRLQTPIPRPIAKGEPCKDYPWPFTIMKWIEGESADKVRVKDKNKFAVRLAGFIKELHKIETEGGPLAGEHNFYRGGDLSVYDSETRKAVRLPESESDGSVLSEIWEKALMTKWNKKGVWVHGDMAAGNILADKDGDLCGVIDFGLLGVGDPACDLVMAWTFFEGESKKIFKEHVDLDENTWDRAMGWALWKALISYAACKGKETERAAQIKRTIDAIVSDYINGKG